MNKCVKISIEKFDEFDMQMAEKIACFVWNRPDWDEHLIKCFEMFKEDSECFNLIAFANKTDVIGRIQCMKNIDDETLWYMGDLLVSPEYRCLNIAEALLMEVIKLLKEKNCQTLRSYVEPNDYVSIEFHNKLGFSKKEFQPFNHLILKDRIMFEKLIL